MSDRTCSIEGCSGKHRGRGWCQTHYMRWRKYGDPEHVVRKMVYADLKLCRKCQQEKPRSEFWRARENWDGLRTTCKICTASSNAKWRQQNKARISETSARYWITHKDRLKQYDRERRVRTKVAKSRTDAAWRERNRERVIWYNRMNLSRTRAEWGVDFTVEQLVERMDFFGRKCWICRAETNGIDHVKPIVVGGPHLLANLRPCCPSCNARKGGVWPITSSRLSRWRAS